MTVKELKEKIEKFDENMEVAVQYRDEGGDYTGTDNRLYLVISEDGKLIF